MLCYVFISKYKIAVKKMSDFSHLGPLKDFPAHEQNLSITQSFEQTEAGSAVNRGRS